MQNNSNNEIRSTGRPEQVPMSETSHAVYGVSDEWTSCKNSLPPYWTSMSTDIDSSAECEYGMSVPQEQNFHQKLMTTSQRMERMQEKMDELEAKFQDITKYLQEIPLSPENEMKQPLVKQWHNQVIPELREHLVQKLVNAIFPPSCPSEDRIIKKLEAYARKVENNIYKVANSKSEYYHLLAEKYYKINREIDERRRQRMARRM